jgi:FkbH-like protein
MSEFGAAWRQIRRTAAEGDIATARQHLRRLLRDGPPLSPAQTEKVGRFLAQGGVPATGSLRVRICGQVTTSWLNAALRVAAFADGVDCGVDEADFDNVLQDVSAGHAATADVVVFVPSGRDLLALDDRDVGRRVADELMLWRAAWDAVRDQGATRIVQLGVDYAVRGPTLVGGGRSGGGDHAEIVAATNVALREALPPTETFIDVAALAGEVGRRQMYDARRDAWTRQPWSEGGVLELAAVLWAGIRAAVGGPKKVLVLDCDNTLWGGVVGETGPHGITLATGPDGEAFAAFQRYVQRLTARGVVLAVATKNEPADARGPFLLNASMRLSLTDFAAFEAGWGPKSESLRRIAQTLGLGLDAFVFFDDSPFERGEVRQALPEVTVVEVPADPADYVAALEAGRWFDARELTAADRARTHAYAAQGVREATRAQYGNLEAYLDSLQLAGEVREVAAEDLDRVVQLIGKTNQFNVTTRRHSPAQLLQILDTPRAIGLTLRLRDRFGDYGLVGVVLAVPDVDDATRLRVDTLLLSCRVLGRTAEWFLLQQLRTRAEQAGYLSIVGEWVVTAYNAQTRALWTSVGLEAQGTPDPDGGARFSGPLTSMIVPATFVRDRGA